MDIKNLDLKELKALAYDEGKRFEVARQNIQILNARIQELENEASKVQEVQPDTNH